jgi:septal ring factor EnvC (AmiA/AmiB activator)
MELATVPDTYCPSMHEHGKYVDRVPSMANGLRCLCMSHCAKRKDNIYTTAAMFKEHIKTKTHVEWLEKDVNANRSNYYKENQTLKKDVSNQKRLIGKQNQTIDEKDRTIDEKDRTIDEKDRTINEMRVEMTRMEEEMTRMKRKNTKKITKMKVELANKDRIIEDNLLRKQQLMC